MRICPGLVPIPAVPAGPGTSEPGEGDSALPPASLVSPVSQPGSETAFRHFCREAAGAERPWAASPGRGANIGERQCRPGAALPRRERAVRVRAAMLADKSGGLQGALYTIPCADPRRQPTSARLTDFCGVHPYLAEATAASEHCLPSIVGRRGCAGAGRSSRRFPRTWFNGRSRVRAWLACVRTTGSA